MGYILITGVGGFIGSRVAKKFLEKGYEVIGVDDLSSGLISNVPAGTDFIHGDLASQTVYKKLPKNCDKILHLAGQSSGEISFDNPLADLRKNTHSTLNLIQFASKLDVERIVYASSMSVYGHTSDKPVGENHALKPLSCYGISKLATEHYLRVFAQELEHVILRMFNVYGPGQDMRNMRQGMVSIFLSQALQNNQIEVKGSLERFRDFIYIDDVAEIWFRAANHFGAIGQTINVGTGIKTSVYELIDCIAQVVPNCTVSCSGNTPGDQLGIYANTEKLQSVLGFDTFTSLADGLRCFADWSEGRITA